MAKQNGFGGARVRQPKVQEDDDKTGSRPERIEPVKVAGKKGPVKRTRKAAQSRGTREGREATQRALQDNHPASDEPWTPPSSLESPPSRPGYSQKWIRTSIFGKDDVQNMARKGREGWIPRRADTVPKNYHVPTVRNGQFAGCIGVEGMVLCEMPESRVLKRNRHYRDQADRMARDIDKNISKVNSSIPNHAGFGRIVKEEETIRVRPRTMTSEEGE